MGLPQRRTAAAAAPAAFFPQLSTTLDSATASPPPAVPAASAATMTKKKTKKQIAAEAPESASSPKEDKQKMLEHSRTMARLRRQQQRALTDSLESEFFELSATAAYLRAMITAEDPHEPLPRQEKDRIVHEAFEHAVTQLSPHIPSARAQEMKNLVQAVQRMQHQEDNSNNNNNTSAPLVQVPLAHAIQGLSLDDRTGTCLAITHGSRKESFSFSAERKKSALLFALEETKSLFNTMLEEEAAPLVSCLNMVDFNEMELVPNLVSVVRRILAVKRASEWLLCPALLSFPKTDQVVDQFRDTCNAEQMNKLLNWTIVNEGQIAQLKYSTPRT